MLAAAAIHVGVVYLETDYLESDQDVGSDSRGDRFILSFTGGAPGTELSELRIRTDKDGDGISVGDPLFDTVIGGRGKGGAHGFQVVRVRTADGHTVDATAQVEDGGQELLLRLTNFRAGDRLEFTIDVDEILRNVVDLEIFNDRLDVITSGQEFQDSMLEATFEAPHYETTQADAVFANNFGDPAASHGLALPPDEGADIDSRPNRSAGALASVTQTPKPVEISGHVWIDNDLDKVREPGEPGLAGVSISLWKQNASGNYQDTGVRATTDASGSYQFAKTLGLMPGTYRVVQQQPDNWLSVGAVPGTTGGSANGRAESVNVIADIRLPLGDTLSINQDFAEAAPVALGGFVYRDLDNDGRRDAGETGIAGVQVRLVPIDTIASQSSLTIATAADGSYRFEGLSPGKYEVIEVSQPADLSDGLDSAGTVNGRVVGIAANPGDRIHSIALNGADVGVEYNFAELPYGSLSGFVYLAAPGSDCDGDHDSPGNQPLAGVEIKLQNRFGETVAQTVTNTSGLYQFPKVPVGSYRIVETTPAGLINGFSHVGKIDGVSVGTSIDGGLIQDIVMTPDGAGQQYNFCEGTAASINGRVYHDASNDGRLDAGEDLIPGASVALIDARGLVVATDVTDADGRYQFRSVAPGVYTLREQQPAGYLDGIDSPGTIRGRSMGRSDGMDSLTSIELKQGDVGVDFNFGELRSASIGGVVYIDRDGDCDRSPEEPGLAGVTIELRSATGNLIATAQTDQQGSYRFEGLQPGSYQVFEQQPNGYFHGGQKAGDGTGKVLGADLLAVTLSSGQQVVDFDFCEILPSSISGSVWKESVSNQRFEPGDTPLAGVIIELVDSRGQTLTQTRTNGAGDYRFDLLAPGVYAVRQTQPDGLFHGGQIVGSAGGNSVADDLIVGIELGGGIAAEGYNFPEVPPASISGFVFQDGEARELQQVPHPASLREFQDGLLTEEDPRLAGVTLQLRDVQGRPVDASAAMSGADAPGPIQITTNEEGFYEFTGLQPGTYHVYQVHPGDYVDGLDTPGSTGGVAINQSDVLADEHRLLIASLAASPLTHPGEDAILNITVVGDGQSTNNNFSELLVIPPFIPYLAPPERLIVPGMTEIPSHIESFDRPVRLVAFAAPGGLLSPLDAYRSLWDPANEWAVSWHLSVINGGYPRSVIVDDGNVHSVSVSVVSPSWSEGTHSKGHWTIHSGNGVSQSLHPITLGEVDATALAGDFDGDGSDEAVIFVAGQWYVDLNGNGCWDAGDLWIQLGNELDRPIVGDWDGDGKDDIAIFGRQWQHDFSRIIRDAGLPDPANLRRRTMDPSEALTSRKEQNDEPPRWLRRGNEGSLRADVVDHVFQYGEQVDTPIAGDWNGDGIDQVGVFRGGHWMLDSDGDGRWNDGDQRVQFGEPGDIPIVGDFNGDKIDEIGVVRGDLWIIDTDGDRRLTGNDLQIKVPRASEDSQPVVGDFDGDGKDDPSYYDEAA